MLARPGQVGGVRASAFSASARDCRALTMASSPLPKPSSRLPSYSSTVARVRNLAIDRGSAAHEFLENSVRLLQIRQGFRPLLLGKVQARAIQQRIGKIILRKLIVAVGLCQIASNGERLPVVFARSCGIAQVGIKRVPQGAAQVAVGDHQAAPSQDIGGVAFQGAFPQRHSPPESLHGFLQIPPRIPYPGLLAVGRPEFNLNVGVVRGKLQRLLHGLRLQLAEVESRCGISGHQGIHHHRVHLALREKALGVLGTQPHAAVEPPAASRASSRKARGSSLVRASKVAQLTFVCTHCKRYSGRSGSLASRGSMKRDRFLVIRQCTLGVTQIRLKGITQDVRDFKIGGAQHEPQVRRPGRHLSTGSPGIGASSPRSDAGPPWRREVFRWPCARRKANCWPIPASGRGGAGSAPVRFWRLGFRLRPAPVRARPVASALPHCSRSRSADCLWVSAKRRALSARRACLSARTIPPSRLRKIRKAAATARLLRRTNLRAR